MWAKTSRFIMLAVLIGAGLAGCGGSKSESAFRKEFNRVNATACHNPANNTTHCAEEWQKACEAAVGSGPHEPEGREDLCKLATLIRAQVKKREEAPQRTPEEEEAHKKSLETERRGEEQMAAAQKKVEEAETQGGEHSIRKTEEKVCYESGKSAEECKGPLKETPQEERSEAENRAQQQQGEVEGGARPLATPGCQTGGCVE